MTVPQAGEPVPPVKVATPPRMVCQNCGLGIFNTTPLGMNYVHTVTRKAECRRGRSRQARARRAATSGSSKGYAHLAVCQLDSCRHPAHQEADRG